MGLNIMQRVILKEHPDYDFNRYRFHAGDVVRTLDGALVLVDYSAIEYVSAFPIVRSLKYRKQEFQNVNYSDLPHYAKGSFESETIKVLGERNVKWKVGDIVRTRDDFVVLLYESRGVQEFHGYVISSPNDYYVHTRIYLRNPYYEFFSE